MDAVIDKIEHQPDADVRLHVPHCSAQFVCTWLLDNNGSLKFGPKVRALQAIVLNSNLRRFLAEFN